ncbi:MAG: HD domain-containing protein [Chloroflexi bacterium]|nr:HD domain-containing protein [Chloroflexota bacterium]
MAKLRWPLRLYLATVMVAAALALAVAFVDTLEPVSPLLVAVVFALATAAQVRSVHVSPKIKVNVGDTATFAAALIFSPFVAIAIAIVSSLAAKAFARSQASWYQRAFNAAVLGLGTGAAAATFSSLGVDGRSVMRNPLAAVLAAIVMYLVMTTLIDGMVALQMRRDPISTWWPLHRRDIPQHSALYGLGALAALSVDVQPWALVLFIVPAGLVLIAIRDAARMREQTRQAIYDLADLVDKRDPYTHGHSQRVARYAERLAKRMKLSSVQVDLIREAARMHDVGKISTPDNVLNKPGPLTPHELVEMHAHSEDGAKLLARLPEFWEGAALVRAHHERLDGTGYPRGLAGNEIPVEAYVIAVADAYDAMATDRPYRSALGWPQIQSEFARGRGTQWRGDVVDAMVTMLHEERAQPTGELTAATA